MSTQEPKRANYYALSASAQEIRDFVGTLSAAWLSQPDEISTPGERESENAGQIITLTQITLARLARDLASVRTAVADDTSLSPLTPTALLESVSRSLLVFAEHSSRAARFEILHNVVYELAHAVRRKSSSRR
jgi:hypothetical protein